VHRHEEGQPVRHILSPTPHTVVIRRIKIGGSTLTPPHVFQDLPPCWIGRCRIRKVQRSLSSLNREVVFTSAVTFITKGRIGSPTVTISHLILLDTGATCSLIRSDLIPQKFKRKAPYPKKFVGASNESISGGSYGCWVSIPVEVYSHGVPRTVVYTLWLYEAAIECPVILGFDFFSDNHVGVFPSLGIMADATDYLPVDSQESRTSVSVSVLPPPKSPRDVPRDVRATVKVVATSEGGQPFLGNDISSYPNSVVRVNSEGGQPVLGNDISSYPNSVLQLVDVPPGVGSEKDIPLPDCQCTPDIGTLPNQEAKVMYLPSEEVRDVVGEYTSPSQETLEPVVITNPGLEVTPDCPRSDNPEASWGTVVSTRDPPSALLAVPQPFLRISEERGAHGRSPEVTPPVSDQDSVPAQNKGDTNISLGTPEVFSLTTTPIFSLVSGSSQDTLRPPPSQSHLEPEVGINTVARPVRTPWVSVDPHCIHPTPPP
jgi:hypothetical protein